MTRDTSAAMGGDAVPAEATESGADLRRTPSQTAFDPGTTNPAAAELSFTPAAEDRDVTARLREFSRRAGVPDSLAADAPPAPGVRLLTVRESLQQAQMTGRELLNAQEQYLLAAIGLLVERHQWGPRLFNDTSVFVAGSGDDGDFEHALSIVNNLRVTKRLPYGGSVEARWVWEATENLRQSATGRYEQSSAIVLGGNVPLLRGAGDIAREDLIQAERDIVYAARDFERFRREYLVEIAQDYFQLQNTKASIANQERQLESLRENSRRTQARVAAGRLQAFEQGIADNEVLNAEASLAEQRDQYALQLDRFRVRLGLGDDVRIGLPEDTLDVPEPEIDLDQAVTLALEFRLDLQNERDRLDDQRRAVANARNQLLPDLNVVGDVRLPTDDDERVGGLSFDPGETEYSAGVELGLPLDRKEERLRLRASIIALERAKRDYERARDDAVVAVRASLREVDLSRFQLRLAEQQVEINRRRLRGQQLQEDTIDTQRLLDSQNALLAAENQRDRAKTTLRIAVLNYLLNTDQLRVRRDGTLEPLPGMVTQAQP